MKAKQFYKYLLRNIRRLPPNVQPYYQSLVRGQFKSHSDEEPQRVKQLIEKGIKDSSWLFYTKYGLKKEDIKY